jgi:hypothetical protein
MGPDIDQRNGEQRGNAAGSVPSVVLAPGSCFAQAGPHLNRKGIFRQARSSFDAAKDFVQVSLLARFEFGIVIGPEVEAAFQPDRIALQAVHGSASAALFSC